TVAINRHVILYHQRKTSGWCFEKVRSRAGDVEGDGVVVVQVRQGTDQIGLSGTEVCVVRGVDHDDGRARNAEEAAEGECDKWENFIFHGTSLSDGVWGTNRDYK